MKRASDLEALSGRLCLMDRLWRGLRVGGLLPVLDQPVGYGSIQCIQLAACLYFADLLDQHRIEALRRLFSSIARADLCGLVNPQRDTPDRLIPGAICPLISIIFHFNFSFNNKIPA
jgi:hypothetical protein